MLASTFISKKFFSSIALLLLVLSSSVLAVHADDGFGTTSTPGHSDDGEDFSSSPYTEYGEFNEDEDEAEQTQFLQYGRFFGLSLGIGTHGATGNRGSLWNGGFPSLEFKLHYWFNFSFALQMGFSTAPHFYTKNNAKTDVRMNRLGIDLKYYVDTRDLSSAITFIGPYLLIGGGAYTKAETNTGSETSDRDNSFGFTAGGGLEFTLSPKKVYVFFEGRYDFVSFKDSNSPDFQTSNGLPDLNGDFYTLLGGILFTW